MITERQEKILNTIVQEHINSAQPVSSQLLEKKYKFGIRPAMIRIEMQKLTDLGFLFQPHISAGRVPTDKGYRFFVDNLLKSEILEFEDVFEIEKIFREAKKDILRRASRLTKFLAQESSNFAILRLLERDFIFKEGWEEILKEPEFEEKNFVVDFVKFLEDFEKEIEDLEMNLVRNRRFLNGVNSKIKIFIGKENPFPKGKNFSIISSKCNFLDEKGIISLLGPKRMDYDRNICLINSLMKILEK